MMRRAEVGLALCAPLGLFAMLQWQGWRNSLALLLVTLPLALGAHAWRKHR